jgi:hypothetical protein
MKHSLKGTFHNTVPLFTTIAWWRFCVITLLLPLAAACGQPAFAQNNGVGYPRTPNGVSRTETSHDQRSFSPIGGPVCQITWADEGDATLSASQTSYLRGECATRLESLMSSSIAFRVIPYNSPAPYDRNNLDHDLTLQQQLQGRRAARVRAVLENSGFHPLWFQSDRTGFNACAPDAEPCQGRPYRSAADGFRGVRIYAQPRGISEVEFQAALDRLDRLEGRMNDLEQRVTTLEQRDRRMPPPEMPEHDGGTVHVWADEEPPGPWGTIGIGVGVTSTTNGVVGFAPRIEIRGSKMAGAYLSGSFGGTEQVAVCDACGNTFTVSATAWSITGGPLFHVDDNTSIGLGAGVKDWRASGEEIPPRFVGELSVSYAFGRGGTGPGIWAGVYMVPHRGDLNDLQLGGKAGLLWRF